MARGAAESGWLAAAVEAVDIMEELGSGPAFSAFFAAATFLR
ncbi:hypothetical protein PC116_g32385 [Phytophthora cactorum]|nr:hypothetical protein PC116_g32385 [Phytophthora cactorum]